MGPEYIIARFTMKQPGAYKSISVVDRNDIESLYPLIAAYVQQPSLADIVEELVFDTDSWPGRHGASYLNKKYVNEELREPPRPVDNDAHAALEDCVRSLDLGDAWTNKMLSELDWKKKHLNGEIPDVPEGFHVHNQRFASVALIILFALCKNVEALRVGTVHLSKTWHRFLENYLLKNNYGALSRPGLQRVKTVEFIRGYFSYVDDPRMYAHLEFLDFFRYFHRLPAIESIIIGTAEEYQSSRHLFPAQTSNIKKIEITRSELGDKMLGTIVRISKGLEELTVSIGGLWSTDGGLPVFRPKTLGKSLLQHRGTLKKLDLDIDLCLRHVYQQGSSRRPEDEDRGDDDGFERLGGAEGYVAKEKDEWFFRDEAESKAPLWVASIPDDRKYGYTIGPLHDFEALTHLSIGLRALIGPFMVDRGCRTEVPEPPFRLIDALPPGLEYLCLYGYVKGQSKVVDSHVEEFMEKRTERFPLLKTVKGVDTTVEDLGSTFNDRAKEDELWKPPRRVWPWVEA